MKERNSGRLVIAAMLVASGAPVGVSAQQAPPPAVPAPAPVVTAPATPPVETPAPTDSRIRFNFKDAPFDLVLDFFSRESGLPIINEVDGPQPQGTMTFISGESYSFDDALTILNLNLQPKKAQLQREKNFLYLRSLQGAARKSGDVIKGQIPEGVRPEEIINLTIPLSNSRAETVADEIKPLIGEYGAVTAVPAQNMIIVVETAAQCRRIQSIVQSIDAVRPVDSAYKLFHLKFAKADGVFNALKGLVGQRKTTVIYDKDNKPRTLEEIDIAGLNLQPDPRTNSIIAVGPESRIKVVEELIALVDVPDDGSGGGSSQQMLTFALENTAPQEAAKQLEALFSKVEAKDKPTVIPIPESNKLTVIGSSTLLAEATALLSQVDPGAAAGGARSATLERRAAVIKLRSLSPKMVDQFASKLLTQRQLNVLKFGPTPDEKNLIVTGPDADVTSFERFIAGIDAAPEFAKEVRQVRVAQGDPKSVLAKVTQIRAASEQDKADPVSASLDPESRTITLIGPRAAVERFSALLKSTESNLIIDQEARTYDLAKARPSIMADRLTRMLRPLLMPSDGSAYAEPKIEPADELRTLIVRAAPSQFAVIEKMIQKLDREDPGTQQFRVMGLTGGDPQKTVDRALALYQQQSQGLAPDQGGPVSAELDKTSGNVLISAGPGGMKLFNAIITELDKQAGPARDVRMIELRLAKAAAVKAFLDDLIHSSTSLRAKGGPDPVVEAIEANNSLLVAAQPGQFPIIEALVKNMDTQQTADRQPLRILKLKATDAANIAGVLQTSFDRRTPEQKAKQPVDIQADSATNMLIVSAHPDVLPEIEKIVGELNQQGAFDADGREIRIFPLKVARAEELAQTIDQMYPEPPMPLDPRTRLPRPDLQRPREVVVRADRATNSLIVDAPAKRLAGFEQLVRNLDQQKIADNVELRTYRVERADLNAAATGLRNAAGTGALYATGQKAQSTTPVTVDVEPVSRTLIVTGPSEVFPGVEAVLKKIDALPEHAATGVKMFALNSARAERIQPLVQRVVAGRVREQEQAAGRNPAEALAAVEVAADSGSNTIVVSAPEGVMTIAEALVNTLDQQAAGGGAELRVFRLKRGEAASVAKTISQTLAAEGAGDPAATVTPEPASNSVVVVGTGRQLDKAGKLVEQLDATTDVGGVGVRTIKLKFARAESIAPVLETLLKKQSAVSLLAPWQVPQYLAAGGKIGDDVRVASERATNTVVVSAPVGVLDMAEQIVAELDSDPSQGRRADRPVRVITLTNADANELATNVQAVLGEPKAGEEPATVRVDHASNSLIVRASPEQMASIEDLAKRLDAATVDTSRQMRMVSVDRSRADAAVMAQTLKRLMEQQSGVKVEVISAEELLKQGSPPGEPKKQPDAPAPEKDKPATHGDASGAKGGLGRALAAFPAALAFGLMSEPGASAKGSEPPANPDPDSPPSVASPGITIAVDPATNSLIVLGSPRATDRIAALAAQLEKQMPAEPTRCRIVALPGGADAEPLAQIIRQTVQQIGRAGAANPGGFTGQVSCSSDPAGGALFVWANDTDFRSVTDLIKAVAQLDGGGAALTIKVYPLSSVTAAKAIQAVGDLFAAKPQGRQAQRLRGSVEINLQAPGGQSIQTKIDPSQVRMTADPSGTAIIVAAPAAALPLIDNFLSLIDQSPVTTRLAIRRYDLKNARSQELAQTLQTLMDAQRQGPTAGELPQARFVPDLRTNSILVTASDSQHADVARLLQTMDADLADNDLKLEIITLQNAQPTAVQRIVEQVVVGRNPALKERVQLSAQDGSALFVVRAPAEQLQQIKDIVSQVDKADAAGLPVRYVKLERADAQSVASALQKFFQDRAAVAAHPGPRSSNRVAITGDRRSGTLIISCNDEDFAQVQALVATFDAPAKAHDLTFKVVVLQNARVGDLRQTIEGIADQLQWERLGNMWSGRANDAAPDEKLFVQSNERTNSVVLMGQGESLEAMTRMIAELDKPASEQAKLSVKAVQVERGDLRAMAEVIRQVTATPGWQNWRGQDPDAVAIQIDGGRRTLLMIGKKERVEQAAAYVNELKGASGRPEAVMEAITLKHAQAGRAAETLKRVFTERAQAGGAPADQVSIIGSQDGNLLVISADPVNMKSAKDLLGLIDQPELGKDRQIDVYVVHNREAEEIAALVRSQFPRSGGRPDAQVIITPQPSTNSIIVSAQSDDVPQIQALVKQLDTPPTAETTKLVTVSLKNARAEEVANALRSALPQGLKVKITPIRRNNTLLLTGSDETVKVVLDQIAKIDVELDRPLIEVKRVKLKNALASDVSWTLEQMLRGRPRQQGEPETSVDYTRSDNTLIFSGTSDQIRDIDKMIEALDVATENKRKTEFVKLQFAKAEATSKALEVFYGHYAPEATTPGARNVTIVPDPASNSLVVSAEEGEWEGLRSLLKKLDTEEYDTSRQLAVIPLKHADATSLARAIDEGFRAPVESRLRQAQQQQNQQGRSNQRQNQSEPSQPLVLVDSEPTPTVSAEPQTNSLVVFAGRQDMQRIKALVAQIDLPDFLKFPEAHVIPLKTGKASQIAASVRELFANQPKQGPNAGPRSTVIVGDDTSNSLIIRAEDPDYAQIKALAEVLQQQGDKAQATVRILTLKNVPAARLQKTLNTTFAQAAKQRGEVLSVEVDRTSNSLVIASSGALFEEIEKVVNELDGAMAKPDGDGTQKIKGGLGQSVFIIDVLNNAPDDVRKQLEQLGVTKPQPEDRPGVVSEPVTIVPLLSRRAIAVIASPQDGEAVVGLVRALDATPAEGEQRVAIVGLKLASATPLVQTLTAMLNPTAQASKTGPATALAEQVRRLNVARNGLDKSDPALDLAKPIRLIADEQTNSIIIGSTPENVASLQDVIKTLDALPIGDAVVVRIFPLSNASATRAKGVIDDLFKQGDGLRRLPGTKRQGLPTTSTGRALAGEIAVTVDERTNTLIAAGRDEAVALVEVLIKDLDSDQASKWIEPTLIPLQHADAVTLGATLRQVLVQGMTATPEAVGLQKQIGRLRMLKTGAKLEDPNARVQADLFAPLTGLVIAPEPQLNALIVIGSPANNEIVRELVGMLDVEAAAVSNTVRVYPLQHAAADRVSGIVSDLFRQRAQLPQSRPEDRMIITPDIRTNSLIVSSSNKNFSILEAMLRALDNEKANNTVGLHVIPVTGADPATLGPKIEKLMKDRITAAQQSGELKNPLDAFSIEADAANGLLIVACSDENLQLVRELVSALAKDNAALAEASRTDLITLKSGRAADAAATLKQLYVDKENAKRGKDSVAVIANERLNALVATGTEGDIAAIHRLVDRLQNADVTTSQEIRRIGLKSANAMEVVQLLQNVLAGRTVSGGNDIAARQATNIRFFREELAKDIANRTGNEPTEAQVDGAIREQVTLTPDLRTNSVMIKAPTQVMHVILDMLDDLDNTSAGARRIEEFTLKNADVRQMADLLKDMFTLRQQGSKYVLVPTQISPTQPANPTDNGAGPPPPAADAGFSSGTVTPVPDERQELAIAVDARTNTLIVSGTEEYLKRVKQVVEDLDSIEATERIQKVYAVKNAKAKEMEQTLQAYFKSESGLQKSVLGPEQTGTALRRLEQEVTVVGDEKSNKLVISTSPRYVDMVMSMVKELDASPPQVVIQVLLAEVTVNSADTWGADFHLNNLTGESVNVASLAAGAGVASALGVPNLTFASSDFDLILRALETQGKLQVLSRPYVTARNNEPASIQVGDNVAIVTNVNNYLGSNTTQADVERRDIGIILNVTPSISPDGFVRMDLKPEISSLSNRTTQISADFSAPVITQRKISTTVTVKDGQTVVVGGLIQTTLQQQRTKVPLLGDIPFLGALFRSHDDSDIKTELLVILTPKVIYNDAPEGIDRIHAYSEHKIDQLDNPKDVRDALKKDGLYTPPEKPVRIPLNPPAPANEPTPAAAPDAVPPSDAAELAAKPTNRPNPSAGDTFVPGPRAPRPTGGGTPPP